MALYNPQKKYLFVHVYRAGGMSIRRLLSGREVANKHAGASEVKPLLDDWDDLYKFAVIRNPFDWMVSTHEYIQRNSSHPAHDKLLGKSFERFLDWYYSSPLTRGRTLSFMVDGLDHLLRFETLARDWSTSARALGLKKELPHINAIAGRLHYRSYYDSNTKRMIGLMFRKDLKRFGYKF